ncbi:MAG: hypothetical protein AAB343_01250 [Patescibacteria group bacterium]
MARHTQRFVLLHKYIDEIIIIVASAVLMIESAVLLVYRETWIDEILASFKSYLILTGEFVPYVDSIMSYPPFVIPTFGYVQYLFGPSIYAGRILAACFFVMLYAVMLWVAARLSGKRAAAAAAALLVSNVLLVSNYITVTMYALATLLLMLTVVVELIDIRRNYKALLNGLLFGLLLLSRINFLPALLAYLLFQIVARYHARSVALWAAIVIVVVVLGYIPIIRYNPTVALSDVVSPIVSVGIMSQLQASTLAQTFDSFITNLSDFVREYYGFLLLFFVATVLIIREHGMRRSAYTRDHKIPLLIWMYAMSMMGAHYFYWKLEGNVYYANYFMPFVILFIVVSYRAIRIERSVAMILLCAVILLNGTLQYRKDIIANPHDISDLERVRIGAEHVAALTEKEDNILTFDDSLYHAFLADRRVFAPLLQRNFLFVNSEDTAYIRSIGFYNWDILNNWLAHDADVVLIHKETGFEGLRRNPFWGEGEDTDARIATFRAMLNNQFQLVETVKNVYPRKYTEGNDGGTLLIYKRKP